VKALFKAKFGEDVDEDSDDEDSMVRIVTRGAAPTTEQLDTRLSDVKALFKAKFGEDVDEDSDTEDSSSPSWTVTRGAAAPSTDEEWVVAGAAAAASAEPAVETGLFEVGFFHEDTVDTATTEPRRGRHGSCAVM